MAKIKVGDGKVRPEYRAIRADEMGLLPGDRVRYWRAQDANPRWGLVLAVGEAMTVEPDGSWLAGGGYDRVVIRSADVVEIEKGN